MNTSDCMSGMVRVDRCVIPERIPFELACTSNLYCLPGARSSMGMRTLLELTGRGKKEYGLYSSQEGSIPCLSLTILGLLRYVLVFHHLRLICGPPLDGVVIHMSIGTWPLQGEIT